MFQDNSTLLRHVSFCGIYIVVSRIQSGQNSHWGRGAESTVIPRSTWTSVTASKANLYQYLLASAVSDIIILSSCEDVCSCYALSSSRQYFSHFGTFLWMIQNTKKRLKSLAQWHNTVPPVRIEPANPRAHVKHFTTESHWRMPCCKINQYTIIICFIIDIFGMSVRRGYGGR